MSDKLLVPGTWVVHPGHPEWGQGQVQSNIDAKTTVNFEERGKVVINSAVVSLEIVRLADG